MLLSEVSCDISKITWCFKDDCTRMDQNQQYALGLSFGVSKYLAHHDQHVSQVNTRFNKGHHDEERA